MFIKNNPGSDKSRAIIIVFVQQHAIRKTDKTSSILLPILWSGISVTK